MYAIVVAIIATTSAWVYVDATLNKIGKIPEAKGMFNMSAGAWAIVTLGLWIVGFPAYLIKRKSLIAKAKTRPVEVKARIAKTGALALVGGLWTFVAFNGPRPSLSLPACDSSDMTNLVGRLITDLPIVKEAGVQYVSMKNIEEPEYDREKEVRACTGTLVPPEGEDVVQYRIWWDAEGAGQVHVEAQIL